MASPLYIVVAYAPPTLRSQLKELVNGELLEVKEIASLAQVAEQSRIDVLVLGKDLKFEELFLACLLYTSPSPRDRTRSRMPSSA